eukprot:CAMPEP_0194242432 /NCGR_PEP_ID=MMETSP0158-20130606/7963_1 /TAXON_ID=33649 /ORGANISM="Thalassionema nitzschioides, Strain L26-B" /LENGTH=506 /DNA_ID=CAMNT_0038977507 /DNA_START=101 /DNA_END=1621 /DNA_ORIENTATION=+
MTSIPYDPSLVLGQLVYPNQIEELMEQAEIQKPQDRANDKFNTMVLSVYKFERIFQQMINMGVEGKNLEELRKQKGAVKAEMVASAIDLGKTTIVAQQKIFEYKMARQQKQISMSIESPIDFPNSPVIQFPASFDTMKFDVQMFRNEEMDQSSSAHASSVATKVGLAVMGTNPSDGAQYTVGVDASFSSSHSMAQTAEKHEIDSTIVITCVASHRMADLIEPCILHPVKLLNSWNALFPNDQLQTDPQRMFMVAMEADAEDRKESPEGNNAISLLSGCTKSSSFIGYVHILKSDETTSKQRSDSVASALQVSIERDWQVQSMSGNFGVSASAQSTAASLLSTSGLQNSCSFTVTGVIPTIECHTVETTVKKMQPDSQTVMKQLGTLNEATNSGAIIEKGDRASDNVGEAKIGGQFISLNNEYLKESVSALSEYDKTQNQVIDLNSMWTAFDDYRDKVREGNCGVPNNFFIKQIKKEDVAKNYIRTFYPNGGTGPEAMKGALGQQSS